MLTSRIDRLTEDARRTLQLSSVIGRSFYHRVLKLISDSSIALDQHLSALQRAELIREAGRVPELEYIFRHDLTREAAYSSILLRERREFHRRVGEAVEELFNDRLEEQPHLLAHHFYQAGDNQKAMKYSAMAGGVAARLYAHHEATTHYTRAIELARQVDTPERDQQDLTFHVSLGNSLAVTKGWAAPEVEDVYTRALELCQQTGDTSQLLPVLWGLSQVYIVRANVPRHRDIGKRLLSLAQSQQDPVSVMATHWVMGVNLFHAGDCAASREHIGQAYTLHDPGQHRAQIALFGIDLGVFALSYMAHTLWCLGYPEQALHKSHEAVALAQKLSDPFSLTVALAYAAMLSQFRRQMHATRERAGAIVALCEGHGFAYYLAWGTIVQGWVGVESGEVEDGMAEIHKGLTALRATGSSLRLPYYRSLLAAAFDKTGQAAEGLRALDEAFTDVQQTGERWVEAELHRLKGELLLQKPSDNSAEAETCFQKALDIARQQQAKSWELRAATSLARLRQSQGRCQEAYDQLAPVYGWFTEGFDTADLQEAKFLLEELS